jgi:hypothetical protein
MTSIDAPTAADASRTGRLLRSVLYCAVLIPVSAAALVGADEPLVRTQRRLLGRAPDSAAGRVGTAAVGLVLGVLALIPLGTEILFVARGALYGVVDPGPYDTSWGGPSLAGAWAMHFLVAVPIAVVGLLVLRGIALLHLRWSRRLDDPSTGRWVLPVIVLACLAGTALFIAWTRQI